MNDFLNEEREWLIEDGWAIEANPSTKSGFCAWASKKAIGYDGTFSLISQGEYFVLELTVELEELNIETSGVGEYGNWIRVNALMPSHRWRFTAWISDPSQIKSSFISDVTEAARKLELQLKGTLLDIINNIPITKS